jgi:hypothetical protein
MQCARGYGLSTDKTQCNKCTSSACADCPGNPSVCKTPINNKPIPNCSYGDDNNEECFDCDDGYVLTADSKTCFKCTAPNCSNCSPSKPAVCTGVRNSLFSAFLWAPPVETCSYLFQNVLFCSVLTGMVLPMANASNALSLTVIGALAQFAHNVRSVTELPRANATSVLLIRLFVTMANSW